ncbi:MAG TPA: hypothetical protein VJ828_03725 [Lacipirellulaceae bacterium]|nr:hypothetical protein [Lacipirellulaceae bacterium]
MADPAALCGGAHYVAEPHTRTNAGDDLLVPAYPTVVAIGIAFAEELERPVAGTESTDRVKRVTSEQSTTTRHRCVLKLAVELAWRGSSSGNTHFLGIFDGPLCLQTEEAGEI